MTYLTIDAGTTNTRTTLWQNGAPIARAQCEIGVRNTAIDGHNQALKNAVSSTIESVLKATNLPADSVTLALASGMITSSMGLKEVPHLTAPSGLSHFAAGMQRLDDPHLAPGIHLPLWLVPGVRNRINPVSLHNVEAMDMMRGEETEAIGLIARLTLTGPVMFIMPGSHTKLVSIDAEGCITGCATTLAGELLQVITQNTLISQSLDADFADDFLPDMVLEGASAAQKTGLARACFSVRTLALFTESQRNERANYLLGAVLSGDLLALKNSSAIQMQPDTPIIITGKSLLRQALALLIEKQGFFYGKRTIVTDEQQADLAGFGALTIAKARGLIT